MRLTLGINAAGDMRLQCLRDKPDISEAPATALPSLDCSSVLQEMTTPRVSAPRHGFGAISTRNTLSRYARTLVREAGALLDNGPLRNLVFLTGTLPGSTPAALQSLSAWSGWVVQTLCQWIRDNAPQARYLGVWEYQKRGALHVHVCIRAASELEANRLKWRWKERWIKILDGVEKRTGVDVYERADGGTWRDSKWVTQADSQTVEKSVARYLAKYLSKGAGAARRRCEDPPSRWWFASRALSADVAHARCKVTVPNLSIAAALDLFERLGSTIAEYAKTASVYVSPYDYSVKGVVALMTGDRASAVFAWIGSVLRTIGGDNATRAGPAWCGIAAARAVFGGTPICCEYRQNMLGSKQLF